MDIWKKGLFLSLVMSEFSTAATDETLNSAASWKLTSPVRRYRGVFRSAEGLTIFSNPKITIGDIVLTGIDENEVLHGPHAGYWVCQLLAIRINEHGEKVVRLRYFEHPHIFRKLAHVSAKFSKHEFIETDCIFEAPIGIILKPVIWFSEPNLVCQLVPTSRFPDYIHTRFRIVNYSAILERTSKKKGPMRRKLWVPLLLSKPTDRTQSLIMQPEYHTSFKYMAKHASVGGHKPEVDTILQQSRRKVEELLRKFEGIPDDISRLDSEIKALNARIEELKKMN